jgi:thioredoxin-like negative regulator of GroEL
MINISQNRQVVEISRQTVVPISYVPYIVLYVNGKPYIRYDGPHEENEIKRFIFEVANNLQNREKFIQSENKAKQVEKSKTPQYTIGIPLFGDDDDYYLEFNQAYVALKK